MYYFCNFNFGKNIFKKLNYFSASTFFCRRKFYSSSNLSYSGMWDENSKKVFSQDMQVINDFLSENDEKSLMEEAEKCLKRLRYEFDHWDNIIHGFRETEHLCWNKYNMGILEAVQKTAFPPGKQEMKLVHILDLAETGFIKPHIDNIKFCGSIIAGLSLLTDSVMRLRHAVEKDKVIDFLLKRRSLYIMNCWWMGLERSAAQLALPPGHASQHQLCDGCSHPGCLLIGCAQAAYLGSSLAKQCFCLMLAALMGCSKIRIHP